MTFLNALAIISFTRSLIVFAYILIVNVNIWSIISSKNISISWISEYLEPLVSRQGLANRHSNSKNYNFVKYFQLLSYFKKCLIISLIFFGSGSDKFQLISILVVYAINLLIVLYLNPYRSRIYLLIKILAEILMIVLILILLIATKKLQ